MPKSSLRGHFSSGIFVGLAAPCQVLTQRAAEALSRADEAALSQSGFIPGRCLEL